MHLLCNYYVTYKCNASCEFCHFSDHTKFKNSSHASLDDFKKNTIELKKLGVKFIDLTGGEPLLNPNICGMVDHVNELNFQVSITTNCLLYQKYAEKLAGKINLLHFSLDSPDEEEHNNIRKVNCYNSVISSLKIAKSLNEYPDILFTVTNETYLKLPRMYELAVKYDVVLIINPVFSYFGNPGLSETAIEYIDEFRKGKKLIYLNDSFLKLRKDGGNNIDKPKCKAVSRVVVISPNNELILPCYHLGNLKLPIETSIGKLFETEQYKFYKKNEGRFKFCEGCTINCYFEPSFAIPIDYYSIKSVPSKLGYMYQKLIKQKLRNVESSKLK